MKPDKLLLERCIEAYSGKLVSYAYAICGDLESAKDAAQDTFLALCRQDRIDEEKIPQWLFKVCRNKVYDSFRKEKFKGSFPENFDPASEAPPPSGEMTRSEIVKILKDKIADLPPSQREILYLRFFAEKSYDEIAEYLEIPKTRVGVSISRGLENLKKKLNRRDFYGS